MPPCSNNEASGSVPKSGPGIGGREESSKYEGVQRIKDRSVFVANVKPNESRTIYVGKFDKEENAARAHDLAALKCLGSSVPTNFPKNNYKRALEAMAAMTNEDTVAALRRGDALVIAHQYVQPHYSTFNTYMLSFNFSRWLSKYRGVLRHPYTGKWQARLRQGRNRLLGTFDTEEEAARAYDFEYIRLRGKNAITNFDIRQYNVEAILNGEQDEAALYQPENARPIFHHPFMALQHLIGTSKPGNGIGTGSPNQSTIWRAEEQVQIGVSGDTQTLRKPIANVALGLELQLVDSVGDLTLSGAAIGQPLGSKETLRKPKANVALSSELQLVDSVGDLTLSGAAMGQPSGSTTLGFHHATSGAFQHYKGSEFRHATSSAFQNFKRRKTGEPSNQNDAAHSGDQEAVNTDLCLGFQHSSTSAFKECKEINS